MVMIRCIEVSLGTYKTIAPIPDLLDGLNEGGPPRGFELLLEPDEAVR